MMFNLSVLAVPRPQLLAHATEITTCIQISAGLNPDCGFGVQYFWRVRVDW